jgi:GR25 family glycosyltransferase involved in LPS biosynthesis
MEPLVFDETNTFCISLVSHPKRWEKMQARFATLNLKVTRWEASRANTSDIKDKFQAGFNPGQIACAQSHINIWKHMQENPQIEYALVLEDDACFDKNWRTKLDRFFLDITDPNKQKDWDLILLNASDPIHIRNRWVQVEEQYLTGGYVISQRGVSVILRNFHNDYASSDWMTSRLQTRWNSYSYFPWLIIQEGDESTIGSGVDADHAKVVRCLKEIDYSLDNYLV